MEVWGRVCSWVERFIADLALGPTLLHRHHPTVRHLSLAQVERLKLLQSKPVLQAGICNPRVSEIQLT